MRSKDPLTRIPEERVATILARAADLDRTTRETVSLDVIRAAALEAGISPAAVDRALEEYAAGRSLESASPPAEKESASGGRWRRWGRKVVTGLKFAVPPFILGVLIGEGGEGTMPLIVLGWIGLVGIAARLAWKRRPTRRARGYVLRVALMTFAALFGFGSVGGDEDVVVLLMMTGLALLVAGTLAIKVRARGAQERDELAELTS